MSNPPSVKYKLIAWQDISSPYARAGLWYVSCRGNLYECWATSSTSVHDGPKRLNDGQFNWRLIGATRQEAAKTRRAEKQELAQIQEHDNVVQLHR